MREEAAQQPNYGLILEKREKAMITGVTEVESFDDGQIVLSTHGGRLILSGAGLHVSSLLLEEGKLPGTTKKESGHGMGLANVQDVLRKYGAEYTVSCRDRWFRFTCAIPCAVHDMSTDNL